MKGLRKVCRSPSLQLLQLEVAASAPLGVVRRGAARFVALSRLARNQRLARQGMRRDDPRGGLIKLALPITYR